MVSKRQKHSLIKRIGIDIAGFGLVLLGLLTGWLPGPGGIPLVLAGLAILSLNYEWAERLIQDLEKKRVEYTKRYYDADPRTARFIDLFALVLVTAGGFVVYTQTAIGYRIFGIGLIVGGISLLATNQRRIHKVIRKRS